MESKRQSVILMVLCGEDHELKGLSARYSKKFIFTALSVMTPPPPGRTGVASLPRDLGRLLARRVAGVPALAALGQLCGPVACRLQRG